MNKKWSWRIAGAILLVCAFASPGRAQAPEAKVLVPTGVVGPSSCTNTDCFAPCCGEEPRAFLASDRAFPGFIGPISNPILSKDPRSLTEARALFIHDQVPLNPVGLDDLQVYALQLRFAITERLTLIADKDGYAVVHPRAGGTVDGWLNIAAGLKYTFIRDVENQFLAAAGFMYEPQTGEATVFQSHGDGLFTFFATSGKEFHEDYHALGTFGWQVPANHNQNSSFFYTSLHLDRCWLDCLYTLVELNWFHWVRGGNRGIPAAVGEGDGLLNLGTTDVAGNDLVTLALGLKARLTANTELGAAWEFPISNREDLIDNRLLVEMLLRY